MVFKDSGNNFKDLSFRPTDDSDVTMILDKVKTKDLRIHQIRLYIHKMSFFGLLTLLRLQR